jgi:P27 family predicted phage terminase small subunit
MRGRRPTPTAILKKRGSWRAKKRQDEPQTRRGRPVCPQWLAPNAKKIWKTLIPELDAMGVLTITDKYALQRYCETFVSWRECREFIRQYGVRYPIKDIGGAIIGFKLFPEVSLERVYAKALLEIEREYGLTPSSRVRLSMCFTEMHEPPHGNAKDKSRFSVVG